MDRRFPLHCSTALGVVEQGARSEERGTKAFALQLKKPYRAITNLETKVKAEDTKSIVDDNPLGSVGSRRETSRLMVKGEQLETSHLSKIPSAKDGMFRLETTNSQWFKIIVFLTA